MYFRPLITYGSLNVPPRPYNSIHFVSLFSEQSADLFQSTLVPAFFTMRNFHTFSSRNPDNSLLQLHPFCVSGFGFYKFCEWKKRGSILFPNRAVERDSEFEFDPDKAREALRKLDQQLDRISQKPTTPVPKIKASSPYDTRDQSTKDLPDTGSFLPYAAFGLLIFTIFYNILFINVIKPSIDGPEVEKSPAGLSIMKQILKAELLPSIQLQQSPAVSVQP
ncbi:hypothetical protein L2E82_35583 [Cichorium intybus]|uniref:Uncharacterized protein n=1 Tax=Cichorium intybus TaxID=13427 RepID=A0ACB9BPB6_CICIN|nr:hypothetical protein L2E82_35583 [Cichorium intybus]